MFQFANCEKLQKGSQKVPFVLHNLIDSWLTFVSLSSGALREVEPNFLTTHLLVVLPFRAKGPPWLLDHRRCSLFGSFFPWKTCQKNAETHV